VLLLKKKISLEKKYTNLATSLRLASTIHSWLVLNWFLGSHNFKNRPKLNEHKLSDTNFVRGLSFANILILASRIELFDTICCAIRKVFRHFKKNMKNTQNGGPKGHLEAFSDPWLAQASL